MGATKPSCDCGNAHRAHIAAAPSSALRHGLLLALASLLLGSCGGDTCNAIACFPDTDIETRVAWGRDHYTIATSSSGVDPVWIDARVKVEAFGVYSAETVVVEPNAVNQNPSPGTGIYPVVVDADGDSGSVMVRFTVRITGAAGSYPKGEFPYTATYRHLDETVTATTVVVVQ